MAPVGGIMKKKQEAPTLSLKNLSEFEKWQDEYYKLNNDVSFTRADNPNINQYSGEAYEILNPKRYMKLEVITE
ncbi:MAG: hypothetical protein NC120_09630 [Ruminococcus sp.]|nr:hypothetical protein [Ruminococcus sp.]